MLKPPKPLFMGILIGFPWSWWAYNSMKLILMCDTNRRSIKPGESYSPSLIRTSSVHENNI